MADKSSISLPIIDMKKAKDPAHRLDVAKQLVHTLETVGFLFVDNVEGFAPETLLDTAKWFFELDSAQKHKVAKKRWNPLSQNNYRGYFPLQPEEVSYKEGFEIGQDLGDNLNPQSADRSPKDLTLPVHPFFQETNLWPKGVDGCDQFQKEMLAHYNAVLQCGSEILRLVSLGCGLPEDWFQSMFFPGSLSTLRLLHYPPRAGMPPDVAMDGDTVLCCSEHSDSGFVTLLATFNYKGLQIRGEDGRWVDVPCQPNSLIMNIGDMLSAMSGGRFKATRHRVIDTKIDRFSVPFFFEPKNDADITLMMPADQAVETLLQESDGKSGKYYGPWLIGKMRNFAEYRDTVDSFAAVLG